MSRTTIGVILGAELRAWRNRLTRGQSRRATVLAVFLAIGAFIVGATFFSLSAAASDFLPPARDAMLVAAFTALSILMLVIGFPTVIATFFVGSDLIQLVLAPVRPVEIFLARSLLAMRANLLLGFIFAAIVFGIGAGAGASPIFYVVAVPLVLVQVLVITALQAVLLSGVLRLVPARLARDVSVVVASVTGAGLYLAWQVTLRQAIGRRPDISSLLSAAHRVDWLPSAWPGHALSAVMDGSTAAAFAWLGLTLLFAALLITAAVLLYGQTLLTGLGQLGGAPSRWKPRSTKTARADARGAASPEFAIARKDWISYRRDVRRLSRLLPAVIFLIGYAVFLVRPQRGISTFWNDVFIVAFISLFMSMAVATSSIPSERRGFQLLRMAPIKMSQVIRSKILLTMLPIIGLTVVISVVVAVLGSNSVGDVIEIAILALWLGLGFVSIGVSVGGIDPRFEAVDDRRMVGAAGTLAGLGAELGFGALTVLSFALLNLSAGVLTGASHVGDLPSSPLLAVAIGGLAVLVAAAGVGVVALVLWTANSRLGSFEAAIAAT